MTHTELASQSPLISRPKIFSSHKTHYTALILLFIHDSWELAFQVLPSRIPQELEPRWGVIGSGKGEIQLHYNSIYAVLVDTLKYK